MSDLEISMSSEDSDLESVSSSESESSVSDSSGPETGSETDQMESQLPETFKDKEPRLVFSRWALKDLRGFVLGKPISKEERARLTDKYYVSEEVFSLFQTARLSTSPLAMLKFEGSSASRDVAFIHNEVNFSLRLLINLYERNLLLNAKFAGPRKSKKKKDVRAGIFHGLSSSLDGHQMVIPNPADAMKTITGQDIIKFKRKFDLQNPDALDDVARWALGYKNAFLDLCSKIAPLTEFAEKGNEALVEVETFLSDSKDQLGDSTRLVGSASQLLKAFREKQYIQLADNSFKDYVKMKKSSMSMEEQKKDRLEVLDEKGFLKKAKDYSKYRKALAVVTREKNLARVKKMKAATANASAKPKQPQAAKGSGKSSKFVKNKGKGRAAKNEKEKEKEED